MSLFTSSMFDSIKNALTNDKASTGLGDILRLEKNKMYTLRLLPNLKAPDKTFFHYYSHAWESFATGQYINCLSPTTFGERDPIGEYRYQVNRQGTQEEKEKAKAIVRRESWLVNVFVIDDPTNPENNGQVKILRYGRQIHKIVTDAISGDDADQFGERIFDLSENGCSLRVKVDVQGDFPSYVSSKFLMPAQVKGLDDTDHESVYEKCFELDKVLPVKSVERLQQELDEHFHCKSTEPVVNTPQVATESNDDDDDIPFDNSTPTTNASQANSSSEDLDDDPLDDDTVKSLLAGLDSE